MDTVIFDLDDTLADTWHATKHANRRLFLFFVKKRMFKLIKALVLRENEDFITKNDDILLQDSNEVIRMFIKKYYPNIDEEVIDGAIKTFDDSFFRNFRLIDGALEVLDHLKGKHRLCIVTDGTVSWQEKKISLLGIRDYFDRIVIAGALGTSKPNKQNFLKALNGKDGDITVVGDRAYTDIKGGKSIGARTILFKNGFFNNSNNFDIKADHTISDLRELVDII